MFQLFNDVNTVVFHGLPDPRDPLCNSIASSVIAMTNKEVEKEIARNVASIEGAKLVTKFDIHRVCFMKNCSTGLYMFVDQYETYKFITFQANVRKWRGTQVFMGLQQLCTIGTRLIFLLLCYLGIQGSKTIK